MVCRGSDCRGRGGNPSGIRENLRYHRRMPGFIGVPELILLGIVLLLIFGPKRLPEIGKSMGKGMREFKQSVSGMTGDDDEAKPAELPAASTDPRV